MLLRIFIYCRHQRKRVGFHGGGQPEIAAEIGRFWPAIVPGAVEAGPLCVAAQAAIESDQIAVGQRPVVVVVNMRQSPGDAAAVAVVSECVRDIGPGGDRRHAHFADNIKMKSVWGILHRVFFGGPSWLVTATIPSRNG